MELNAECIKTLRTIPAFCEFSREKMVSDADFWKREAAGSGIMAAAAAGIVAIGGTDGDI